jgi:hypothetical protein
MNTQFCGHPPKPGKPYCDTHWGRVHVTTHAHDRSNKIASDAAFVASGIVRTGLG